MLPRIGSSAPSSTLERIHCLIAGGPPRSSLFVLYDNRLKILRRIKIVFTRIIHNSIPSLFNRQNFVNSTVC